MNITIKWNDMSYTYTETRALAFARSLKNREREGSKFHSTTVRMMRRCRTISRQLQTIPYQCYVECAKKIER